MFFDIVALMRLHDILFGACFQAVTITGINNNTTVHHQNIEDAPCLRLMLYAAAPTLITLARRLIIYYFAAAYFAGAKAASFSIFCAIMPLAYFITLMPCHLLPCYARRY